MAHRRAWIGTRKRASSYVYYVNSKLITATFHSFLVLGHTACGRFMWRAFPYLIFAFALFPQKVRMHGRLYEAIIPISDRQFPFSLFRDNVIDGLHVGKVGKSGHVPHKIGGMHDISTRHGPCVCPPHHVPDCVETKTFFLPGNLTAACKR
jgi:hypothetical protein